MAKYSALKLAKDKVKKLTDDNARLRLLSADFRAELNKSNTARAELLRLNNYLVEELKAVRTTFDKQVKTLKLSGEAIRELQKSRKRLKMYCRVLTVTLVTIILAGAFTL